MIRVVVTTLMVIGKTHKIGSNKLDIDFHQNDYKITTERLELMRYNKDYLQYFKIVTYKYNRTTPAINFTLNSKVKLNHELEVILQAYTFLSNEYRLFPLRYQINYCEAMAKDTYGIAGLTKCGNYTGCPFRKGVTYHACNWVIDESRFPPFVPSGRYRIEVQGVVNSTEIFFLHAYGEITRPIPWI